MWRDGSTEVSARENELLRARGWSNNADAGVAMWPCDTTCADGCGRTMNGLFDLHLLCITLRERRARSRYGHRASSTSLSDYTSLFCAKGLLIGAALWFVLLLTDTAVSPIREAERAAGNQYHKYSGKDEEDLMLITIGYMKDGRGETG